MVTRIATTTGMAAVAAIALAAVAGCSSSSSSSSSAPSSAAASATNASASASTSASSGSNPLSGGGASGSVVVGSANFPESELLAEIYAIGLTDKGVKASTKLNIGDREVYYPQVVKGAITVFPEYNGALLQGEVDPTSTAKTTAAVDSALTAKLPSSVEILNPAPAQDSDSMTVTQATATKYHLKSIADLKSHASGWVLGAPSEFKTRPDGIAGLKANYGLTFKSFDPLDESGPLTLAALTGGKVQVADVFTTTPQIITDHLVSLSDPKSNFAAQNVIPLVYKADATSTMTTTLNAISAKLTTAALLQMDNAVITEKQNYDTVATAFLKSIGIS
ncbi:MAG TPA: ABC transporter substrate-binding protein [Trebonia sp.]|jgi:osmoprotectant transport system substrate-binding protein|nr:ABC transporter substrate-binding protein [Trebonia sp.]